MWVGIVYVGLVMAVVTLAALDLRLEGGLLGGTGDVDEARTMAFTTLVLAQLFNCFNARSERASAFHRLFTNRYLWGAVAFARPAGAGRAGALSERRLLDDAALGRRLARVPRARKRRALGCRGEEARDEKGRPAGALACAGEDLNLHGPFGPQGPQPCASTNSATSA